MINSVLILIESDLENIVKYFPLDNRDEIKQEIRIRLWRMMERELELHPDSTKEYLLDFCRINSYTLAMFCSKSVSSKLAKYKKRHQDISEINPSDELLVFQNDVSDFDISKYKEILTKKEFKIFEYLVETNNTITNFDSISRELGYTGKGSAKYNLIRMAQKILDFNTKTYTS